jgi:ABC-2 type transport system permease protein
VNESLARIAAVISLELRTQRREPLTVLYMLVLGLLAAAFAAAGPVELVRHRGAVPRDAAWSMLLAATALTAFGQVITSMVAATVVLRDEADRLRDLLVVTRLSRREYLLGKLCVALAMLCVIYAAIPIGLAAGALLAGGSLTAVLRASVLPFVVIVLPTMLAIGALQFAAGVLSGRLWFIVTQGLILIWIWSACVDAAQSATFGGVAALLDPFGSAAVLRATAAWTDAERATNAMPVTGLIVAGRALWLCLGAAAACAAILSPAREPVRAPALRGDELGEVQDVQDVRAVQDAQAMTPSVRSTSRARWQGVTATSLYVARWMLRDAGWRVLAVLGAVNVGVHAAIEGRSGTATHHVTATTAALLALRVHARLFLILLATIYAGEIVWRERDDRSAPLFDALPVSDLAMLAGRVLGVIGAQVVLVAALALTAALCTMAGTGEAVVMGTYVAGVAQTVMLPFAMWMVVALGVHALVQQKVIGHLLCIAGWVVAVLTVRIDAVPAAGDHLGGWWLVVAAVALGVTWLGWVRGEVVSVAGRFRIAGRRVENRRRSDTRAGHA